PIFIIISLNRSRALLCERMREPTPAMRQWYTEKAHRSEPLINYPLSLECYGAGYFPVSLWLTCHDPLWRLLRHWLTEVYDQFAPC
ncbi:hypothetical protein, partial [Salmonella enterica]|uniref:hypothetical protein n=1 Tax=Salmonella enterica TaxID=28901 RepID=UPI001C38B1B7